MSVKPARVLQNSGTPQKTSKNHWAYYTPPVQCSVLMFESFICIHLLGIQAMVILANAHDFGETKTPC